MTIVLRFAPSWVALLPVFTVFAGCALERGGIAESFSGFPTDLPAPDRPDVSPTDASVPVDVGRDTTPVDEVDPLADVGPSDAEPVDAPRDVDPPRDVAEAETIAVGVLTATLAEVPADATIDLTALGTLDWIHGGRDAATEVNRKVAGIGLAASPTGTAPLKRGTSYPVLFSWTNGTPIVSATTKNGVYIDQAAGQGFVVEVEGDRAATRILEIYCRARGTAGTISVSSSDGSATPISLTLPSVGDSGGPMSKLTVTYRPGMAGAKATVRILQTGNGFLAAPAATLAPAP
jgi:hypothetical protein